MSMKKSLPTKFGVNAEYWKVIETNFSSINKIGRIRLAGYYNQNVKDLKAEMLESKYYNITPAEYDQFFCTAVLGCQNINHLSQSYELIKTKDPDFQDAELV